MDLPRCVVVQRCAAAVGYQNKEVTSQVDGGFSFLLSTLPDVGADLSELTISSFKVVPPEGGLVSEVSVNVQTFDAAGQVENDLVYLDEVQAGNYGCDPGWYTFQSIADWDPVSADGTIIPFGSGVMVISDCGATISFAGNVDDQDETFDINDSVAGGFTFTGNCSPVDLTLKDLSITPPEGGLVSEVSVNVQTFDNAGQVKNDLVYLDDVQAGNYGCDPGWYTFQSIADWDPVSAGNEEVVAGEVFMVISDCGAKITVPSALPATEK